MPSTTSPAPDVTCKGITFLPVPEFDFDCAPFFRRDDRPDVPGEFTNEALRLYYQGGAAPVFGFDLEEENAKRAIDVWLSSYATQAEKVATIAYALWVWSPAAALARAAWPEAA